MRAQMHLLFDATDLSPSHCLSRQSPKIKCSVPTKLCRSQRDLPPISVPGVMRVRVG